MTLKAPFRRVPGTAICTRPNKGHVVVPYMLGYVLRVRRSMIRDRRTSGTLRGTFAAHTGANGFIVAGDLKERVHAHVLDKLLFVGWDLAAEITVGDRTRNRINLDRSRSRRRPRRRTMRTRLKCKYLDVRIRAGTLPGHAIRNVPHCWSHQCTNERR
jgi:hypothetical protein